MVNIHDTANALKFQGAICCAADRDLENYMSFFGNMFQGAICCAADRDLRRLSHRWSHQRFKAPFAAQRIATTARGPSIDLEKFQGAICCAANRD